jgi:hypothetical protein
MNLSHVIEGSQCGSKAESMVLWAAPDVASQPSCEAVSPPLTPSQNPILSRNAQGVSPPLTPLNRRTFGRSQQGVSPPLTGIADQRLTGPKPVLVLGRDGGFI